MINDLNRLNTNVKVFRPQIYLPQSITRAVQSTHPLDFDFVYRDLHIGKESLNSLCVLGLESEINWLRNEFYQILKCYAIRSPLINLKKAKGYTHLDIYGLSPNDDDKFVNQQNGNIGKLKRHIKPFPLVTPFYHYYGTRLVLDDDKDYTCILSNTNFEKHIFKAFSSANPRSLALLLKAYNEKFKIQPNINYLQLLDWKRELKNGFNLILCGKGSKYYHLNQFYDLCKDGIRCMINGYKINKQFPKQPIAQILKKYFKSQVKCTEDIFELLIEKMENSELPLYIIVHGLDYMITNRIRYIDSFLNLLTSNHVRVLSSFDRVWGEVCLNSDKYNKYNLKLITLDTGIDYRAEVESMWLACGPDYYFKGMKTPSFEGLQSVLSALSINHQKLLRILAELQLEYINGVPRKVLLSKAIVICNSEEKLDSLLVEFISHKLVREIKIKGEISYLIPLDNNSIMSLVELQ